MHKPNLAGKSDSISATELPLNAIFLYEVCLSYEVLRILVTFNLIFNKYEDIASLRYYQALY